MSLILSLALLVPQAQGPDPERHFNRTGAFAMVLPDDWRQVTPDEALQLSRQDPRQVPDWLLTPRQVAYYPYGSIGRWLDGDFDGRCLTVQELDGEYPVDEEGISVIRSAAGQPADQAADQEWQREVLSAEPAKIGSSEHPAIQCTVRDHSRDGTTSRSLVLFVPTGGDTLVLSFRAPDDDFERSLPLFQQIMATLTFARPARGPTELSDRLLYPALVGALVGLLLLGLRRRRPAPA